jgi:hypothetical protein
MKNYLVTIKKNDAVVGQKIMDEHTATNFVRKAFAAVYEETSADIKTMHLFSDIEKTGKAKVIEYNSAKMVVQKA